MGSFAYRAPNPSEIDRIKGMDNSINLTINLG